MCYDTLINKGTLMKIKDVIKSITYYVETDDPDFPDYRTDENGSHWEKLMGESWEPVYNPDVEKKLQELFWEYKNQLDEKEDIWIR